MGYFGPNNRENGVQVTTFPIFTHFFFSSLLLGSIYYTIFEITHTFFSFLLQLLHRIRRNEATIKGTIIFDANSNITVSPVNFQ